MFVLASFELPFHFARMWEAERGACGLKQETLASIMRLTPQQLRQQLTGQGHVSFQRFLLLLADAEGRAFATGLLNRIFAEVGLAQIDPFAEWLKQGLALAMKTRMARGELDAVREERRKQERRIA